jgi:hypothetical protein
VRHRYAGLSKPTTTFGVAMWRECRHARVIGLKSR